MRFQPGNTQHIGARASQQDAFGFSDPDDRRLVAHGGMVAVVADGMGGMANGRDASLAATHAFLGAYAAKHSEESIPQALRRSVHRANEAVLELAERAGVVGEMGTTLVAVALHDSEYHLISIGDSAAYLLRGGRLYQLTASHTHGEDLDLDAVRGHISEEEAALDPERHALTSFLGIERLEDIDASDDPRPLKLGDRILICSDGLSKVLTEREIIAGLGGDPQAASQRLVDRVVRQQHPDQDNVTVLVVSCQDDQELAAATSREAPAAPSAAPSSGPRRPGPGIVIPALALTALLIWGLLQSCPSAGPPFPPAPAPAAPAEGEDEGAEVQAGGVESADQEGKPAAAGEGGKSSDEREEARD